MHGLWNQCHNHVSIIYDNSNILMIIVIFNLKWLYHSVHFIQFILFIIHVMYTGKYLPQFYFCTFHPRCQLASGRLGKLQCLKSSLFNQNFDWANSREGETNSNWRAKITQYKNYPVYRMYIWHTYLSSELLNIQVGMPYWSFIYGSYKFLSDKYHTQWQFHFSLLPLS